MLETSIHQGTGLHQLATKAAPRVLAMASHGSQQGELPLLWSLCTALAEMGYPVAVLDATTFESAHNPGLAQLLGNEGWRDDAHDETAAWSVIPAALGLQQLCAQHTAHSLALGPLCGLFENFGAIVIYARSELLTQLLPESGIEPLIAVAPAKMSPVTAYQSLKHLLLDGKLQPTVAAIVTESDSSEGPAAHWAAKNLQECAMTFLGYRLDSLAVRPPASRDLVSEDVHRLALRLLENAIPLHRNLSVRAH